MDLLAFLVLLWALYIIGRYIIGGGIAMGLDMLSDYREEKQLERERTARRAANEFQRLRSLHRRYEAEAHKAWWAEYATLGGKCPDCNGGRTHIHR